MELGSASSDAFVLSAVICALRARVAAWGASGVLAQAVMFLLHRRLGEIALRMEQMVARFRAGRLVLRAPRAVVVPNVVGAEVDCSTSRAMTGENGPCVVPHRSRQARVWPGRFGWLVWAAGYEAAGLSSQLRAVLGSEEMIALLQAAPQARRVLLPLCRALAIETDLLWPGVARVAPGPKAVLRPRVRKVRVKLDLGRIPLPRGVLSAARRQGFGKMWEWV